MMKKNCKLKIEKTFIARLNEWFFHTLFFFLLSRCEERMNEVPLFLIYYTLIDSCDEMKRIMIITAFANLHRPWRGDGCNFISLMILLSSLIFSIEGTRRQQHELLAFSQSKWKNKTIARWFRRRVEISKYAHFQFLSFAVLCSHLFPSEKGRKSQLNCWRKESFSIMRI